MTNAGPSPRPITAFNGSRLLLTRLLIVAAALVVAVVVTMVSPTSFQANHVYAVTDLVLSCVAIPRLRRGGWVLVGVHMLISLIWCEIAWNLPERWFA